MTLNPQGRPLALLCAIWLSACAGGSVANGYRPIPSDSAKAMMRRGVSAALQVRGEAAVAFLRPIPPAALDAPVREVRACMLERLGDRLLPPMTVADPFVAGVLATYRKYWMRALQAEAPTAELDAQLLDSLNAQLVDHGARPGADLDSIEGILQPILEARGYHPLLGVTSPLRELMLWRSERTERFEVPLPEGPQPVTVVFLDDFASLGWVGFATCDRYHTGGWTKPDRLYAVQSAYDTTSEAFRVSYLAHEGQHFWDTVHLPADLPQDVLEYRAKLVELAVGRATVYDLLTQFEANSGQDPAVPHSYANGRVIHDLRARLFPGTSDSPSWRNTPVEAVNAAASALLTEDNLRRSAH